MRAGGANKDRRRAELDNAMSLLGSRPLFEGVESDFLEARVYIRTASSDIGLIWQRPRPTCDRNPAARTMWLIDQEALRPPQ